MTGIYPDLAAIAALRAYNAADGPRSWTDDEIRRMRAALDSAEMVNPTRVRAPRTVWAVGRYGRRTERIVTSGKPGVLGEAIARVLAAIEDSTSWVSDFLIVTHAPGSPQDQACTDELLAELDAVADRDAARRRAARSWPPAQRPAVCTALRLIDEASGGEAS